MKWTKTIVFQYWLGMMVLSLAGILSFTGFYFWKEADELEQGLRLEGISVANTVGSAIGLPLMDLKIEEINPLAYALALQPDIQYVIIRDLRGNIISQKGETMGVNDIIVEKVPVSYLKSPSEKLR